MIVCIDPGHQVTRADTGAQGNGVNEAHVTMEFSTWLAWYLENLDIGVDCVLTRTGTHLDPEPKSESESLRQRVQKANDEHADLFISIHCNAHHSPLSHGAETFVYKFTSPAMPYAEAVQRALVNEGGRHDRGVKENPDLYVLKHTKMPAILVELGFLTNARESQVLTHQAWQRSTAEAMARAIGAVYAIQSGETLPEPTSGLDTMKQLAFLLSMKVVGATKDTIELKHNFKAPYNVVMGAPLSESIDWEQVLR